jgi:hypothetical protein
MSRGFVILQAKLGSHFHWQSVHEQAHKNFAWLGASGQQCQHLVHQLRRPLIAEARVMY